MSGLLLKYISPYLSRLCAALTLIVGFNAGSAETNQYAVHGRAVGTNGEPVRSATVKRDGVGLGTGRGWGWANDGWPEQALTDTNGEFTIRRDKAFTEVQIRINADGYAPWMAWLPVSNAVQTLHLVNGVMIRGRVLNGGHPLANVRLGLAAQDRNSEVFAGYYYATTDAEGQFAFPHVQTNTAWYLYGVISSLKPYGCLPPVSVTTLGDGTTNGLADFSVQPGLHLSGVVKTRHGQPLPKGLTVCINDNRAWDSETTAPDPITGRFEFSELFPGTANVSLLQMPGWRLSGRNRSLDVYNESSLQGLLEKDKDDLQIEIEPGSPSYFSGSGNGQLPSSDQPEHKPIEGCEGAAGLIVLAGQVVDDETGQPLKNFRVIPGYKPPHVATASLPTTVLEKMIEPLKKKTIPWNEIPFWNYTRTEDFSNGAFSVGYMPLSSLPLLRIEADGYDPYESEPIVTNAQNLVIRLKQGVGPSGVVLRPDGSPAEGATVVFAASHEQCELTNTGLNAYGAEQEKTDHFRITGKDGSFSFPARAGGQMLFAAHSSGWAQEPIANGAGGIKLRLEPWAVVKGTLVYGGGTTGSPPVAFTAVASSPPVAHTNGTLAAGIELHLSVPMNNFQRGDPFVNTELYATTDAQGHFEFRVVPPGRLDLVRLIRFSGGSGWSSVMQTWLIAESGKTNDLGNVMFDLPPPLPLSELVKQKLGL